MKKLMIILFLFYLVSNPQTISNIQSYYQSNSIKISLNKMNQLMQKMLGFKKETDTKYQEFKDGIDSIKNKRDIFTEISDDETTNLFSQLKNLETIYYERLLQSYDINIEEYQEALANNPQDEEFKKQYIMEHANISETEYNEKFVNPLTSPTFEDNTTLQEITELYKTYLEDHIDYISELTNSIK